MLSTLKQYEATSKHVLGSHCENHSFFFFPAPTASYSNMSHEIYIIRLMCKLDPLSLGNFGFYILKFQNLGFTPTPPPPKVIFRLH